MKILSILFVLGLSTQAQAFQIVEASGLAADCCFRTIGDIDLIVDATKEVKKNLLIECKKLYGDRGILRDSSQKVLLMESTFASGGTLVTVNASAACFDGR